ncbi:MAG: rod shape-determining protein RodA [Candidatus Yanofskybacteria bacterium]|nr:rod shape-determining protein RodA [Candidatus Yanofskybacteria bacterium]
MSSILRHIMRFDLVIVGSALLLSGIGLLSLYSSSLSNGDFSNFTKQAIFLSIGLLCMVALSFFDWRLLKNEPFLILLLYGIGIAALLGLFFFAHEVRGTKRWFRIWEISVDPIEYVKLILIVLMAKFFSFRHIEMYRIQHIILSGLYFAIPIAFVFFQPDLGTAMLLVILWITLLLVSGIKIRHFLALVGMGILIVALGWTFFMHDYQKDRIFAFLEPELDPFGIGWSQLQSKIAIGNGGLLGAGFGKGTQTQHSFLSEPQTDFIFAAIAEEFGFLGVFALFTLFIILTGRILSIGIHAKNNFPRLFATGIACLLVVQFAVNIGMNLGLLPIAGLPLPLVSYGGSSLILTYAGLGILQSIHTH